MSRTTTRRYAAAAVFAGLVAAQFGAAGPVHDAQPPAAAAVRAAVGMNAAPLSCVMTTATLAGGLRMRAFTAQSAKNFAVQTRQACDEVRH